MTTTGRRPCFAWRRSSEAPSSMAGSLFGPVRSAATSPARPAGDRTSWASGERSIQLPIPIEFDATSDAHAHVAASRAAPRWTRPRVRRYVVAIVHAPHDATPAGNATWCRFDGAERPRKYVNATAPNAVAPAVA